MRTRISDLASWLVLTVMFVLGGHAPSSATDLSILYPASAADLRPVSWTGFIISPSFRSETLKFSGAGSAALKSARGFALGAEVGYDWQTNGLVFGVVGNALGANVTGDGTPGLTTTYRSRMDAYGMVRARVGLPIDRILVFGTVGLAAARVQIENWPLGLSDRQVLTGWAAGGGVEFVYNRRITLRAEYTHIDLGERNFTSLKSGGGDVGAAMDNFKFGLVTRY